MKLYLILLPFLFLSNLFGHTFYMSITDLEYNADKNRIEGSIQLTAHDFEIILENKFGRKIDIENVVDSSEIGKYVQTYLADHLKIYSDKQQSIPIFIGKEVNLRQELYFYFAFTKIKNPREIKVINTILFAIFPKQQNIIHYKYKKQTKSVTLVSSKNHEKITFD